jgi:hypothetical protein
MLKVFFFSLAIAIKNIFLLMDFPAACKILQGHVDSEGFLNPDFYANLIQCLPHTDRFHILLHDSVIPSSSLHRTVASFSEDLSKITLLSSKHASQGEFELLLVRFDASPKPLTAFLPSLKSIYKKLYNNIQPNLVPLGIHKEDKYAILLFASPPRQTIQELLDSTPSLSFSARIKIGKSALAVLRAAHNERDPKLFGFDLISLFL